MHARSFQRILTALGGLIAAALPATSDAAMKTIGEPDIRFVATGPAGLTINGTSRSLQGGEDGQALVLTASLTNLRTGIGLRDKHLQQYLQTDKHPNAKLSLELSQINKPEDKKTVSDRKKGNMTLHGVTRPVSVQYKAKRLGSDLLIEGSTEIDIRDFKIEVPCHLGICVQPQVKVEVKFKLRDG
jgi:polyisoprenoid-binding protein YceI